MQIHETARPAGCGSTPVLLHAYGELVTGLLNQQEAQSWQNDLWTIFNGYMCNHANEGNNPKIHDLFCTFRDLHQFFEGIKAIEARKEGRNQ